MRDPIIEGTFTVEPMRSDREPHDCICCHGPHVFAVREPMQAVAAVPGSRGPRTPDLGEWVQSEVSRRYRSMEGGTFRVIVERVGEASTTRAEGEG